MTNNAHNVNQIIIVLEITIDTNAGLTHHLLQDLDINLIALVQTNHRTSHTTQTQNIVTGNVTVIDMEHLVNT